MPGNTEYQRASKLYTPFYFYGTTPTLETANVINLAYNESAINNGLYILAVDYAAATDNQEYAAGADLTFQLYMQVAVANPNNLEETKKVWGLAQEITGKAGTPIQVSNLYAAPYKIVSAATQNLYVSYDNSKATGSSNLVVNGTDVWWDNVIYPDRVDTEFDEMTQLTSSDLTAGFTANK